MSLNTNCNCSHQAHGLNVSLEHSLHCLNQLRELLDRLEYKVVRTTTEANYEAMVSADIYSVVILSLFASIISLLMVRAIKPSQNVDDQVIANCIDMPIGLSVSASCLGDTDAEFDACSRGARVQCSTEAEVTRSQAEGPAMASRSEDAERS